MPASRKRKPRLRLSRSQENDLSAVSSRFLRAEEIDQVLREARELSRDQGIAIALVGGVALQLYGSDRFTKDVDVIAESMLSGLQERGVLTFGGYETLTPSGLPIDVILRADDYAPLYEAALDDAVRIRGVPIPVARPEYIATMKLIAKRPKDDVDLEDLIRRDVIDLPKTRRIIHEHVGAYALDDFDTLVREVEALGSRRRS